MQAPNLSKLLSILLYKVPKIYAVLIQTYLGSSAILVEDIRLSYPVRSWFFFPVPTISACCIEGSSVTTHHFVSSCSIDFCWDVRNNFQWCIFPNISRKLMLSDETFLVSIRIWKACWDLCPHLIQYVPLHQDLIKVYRYCCSQACHPYLFGCYSLPRHYIALNSSCCAGSNLTWKLVSSLSNDK